MTLAEIRRYFETLTRADLARLGSVYTDDATFKDPFNEVGGLDAIRRVYVHMFDALQTPRFVIHDAVSEGSRAFMTWDFRFALRGKPMTIRGATHFVLAADGRIAAHRDYWDAAEELYAKLPLVGVLMRALRRKLSSTRD